MKSKFKKPYTTTQQEEDTDISQDSPPSSTNTINIDGSVTSLSSSSSKKSKRAIEKRVVQIPMKEPHGSRALKVESNTPPLDSWAWRKYGQKSIKGSPYHRGYYKCSSCKGCPARKQVELNRVDPTMLIIWPVSRKNTTRSAAKKPESDSVEPGGFVGEEELGWLGEIDTTSSALLDSVIMAEFDGDVASMWLPMDEEDELLFADLGELPECSTVFRHGVLD